ncbi:MAG TPA: tRNA lysidine(34) synthetase TilS [Terracidiphilus sp.]
MRLDTSRLSAGMRLGVGVSGGADSAALLLALAERAGELGLVLHVAHLHHGLRGAEADEDLEFVRALAGRLGLPFLSKRVDVATEAARCGETIEEAARRVRYGWFRELMGERKATAGPSNPSFRGSTPDDNSFSGLDAVATAHTLDDQAETVLAKILRGAWTEGIAGIHPVVEFAEGRVIRPLLGVRRGEVEAYLNALGQSWREDSSNRHLAFTRNRIRHELLPVLETWNPKLKEHLSQMAELARDEETWWETEVARVAPQVMLTGRPVRGGGRASAEGLAVLEVAKLAELAPALQRRVVRFAVGRLGAGVDFAGTETLRELALTGRAGQKCELAGGLRAERSHRELRLSIQAARAEDGDTPESVEVPVPGEVEAVEFGLRVRIEVDCQASAVSPQPLGRQHALLRPWRAGDRVHLRHSSGPRKVKEVLERMKVSGAERARWLVLELDGRILWMHGVTVEPEAGIAVAVRPIGPAAEG